ncbi:DUF4251 domain-containing protein [Sinomicrobium sp.]
MKHLFYFFGLLVVLSVFCLSSCGGVKNVSPQDMAALDSLIRSKEFRVESEWANPMVTMAMMKMGDILGPQNSIQRVSLIGNPNYLEIRGDSVSARLPYFGERKTGGGYDPDGEGIKFDQKISEMDIEFIDAKKMYRISFDARQRSELYNITLEVFSNKKTNMVVNSSERSLIGFEGSISSIKDEH